MYYGSNSFTSTYDENTNKIYLYKADGTGAEIKVDSVSLADATVAAGKTVQLKPTFTPPNATNKKVTWNVDSGSNYVTIDESGNVTGKAAGEANITVTTDDGGKTATCKVTVTAATAEPTYTLTTSLQDGKDYLIVSANATGSAFALTNPGGSSDGASMGRTEVTIEPSGSDKVIITDKESIVWTAYANGDGFDLTNGDDYLEGKGGNVKIYDSQQYPKRYWTYTGEQLQHVGGDNTYTVYYSNSSFTSSYNSTSNKVYIFENTSSGSTEPVAVNGVELDKTTATITVKGSTQLTATVLPKRAANKNVTWESDKPSVATVDETGKVTGVAVGTANITVTTEDGGHTATCKVTVKTSDIVVEGKDVLGFTSDVHNGSDNTARDRLGTWIDNVKSKYTRIDLMGFCGDMGSASASEDDFWTYTKAVMDVVTNKGVTAVYTTGNHEFYNGKYASTTNAVKNSYTVDAKGAEASNSIIYALGTDNWDNNEDNYTTSQVTKLATFLNGAGNSKPIFVITHYPLHSYSSRTTTNADKVIDALNTAADRNDQTITVLWGHNHTLSDPSYDQIFEPGDSITYKSGTTAEINFYYAAAGCMSDSEYGSYGSSSSGSAFVKGKGLVVVADDVDSDGDGYKDLDFAYYDASGKDVTEGHEDQGVSYKYSEVTTQFVLGNEYVVAAAGTSTSVTAAKYVSSNSDLGTQTLTVKTENGKAIVEVSDSALVWTAAEDGLTSNANSTNILFPTSGNGVMTYTIGSNVTRPLTFEDGLISFTATTSGSEGTWYMTFSNGSWGVTRTKSEASQFRVFVNTDEASDPVPVTGVTLSPTTADVVVGKTTKLTATVAPSDATNKKVTFSSSDEKIATVSSSGVVTGVAVGEVTITVTTKDGNKTATCKINVTAAPDPSTYRLVSSMKNNGEYLIVSSNAAGSAYALKNDGGSSDGTGLAAGQVTVVDTNGTKTISTNADELVWKATTNGQGFLLTNGTDYLESYHGNLLIFDSNTYPDKYWTYGTIASNELIYVNPDTSEGTEVNYQLYYDGGFTSAYYGNTESGPETAHPVYIYEKTDGTTPEPTKYTITWKNGDTTLKTEQVEEGTVPKYTGDEPTKAATAEFTYSFDGWDPEPVAATKDATYTAKFKSTKNEYTITWKNGDETLKTEKVAYGETPAYTGDDPTRAATAEYTYSFDGWDPAFAAVTADATYTAKFKSTKNEYTITWKSGDETLKTEKVAYGETPAYTGDDPTKAATAEYTYSFDGWDPAFAAVTADATYTAKFKSTKNQYTVTFVDFDDTQLSSAKYDYGTEAADIVRPANPTRPSSDTTKYDFAGWTPAIAAVTANATYKATYAETPINPTVETFVVIFDANGHGTAPEPQTIEAGGKVAKPANLTAEGYAFGGWYKEATCENAWNFDSDTVTVATTLYAKWTADTVAVTDVKLPATLSIEEGESKKLEVEISPDNASNKNLTWASSDPTVASVDQDGNVTALKEGTATITATSVNGIEASCEVTVSAKQVEPTADKWRRLAGADRYQTMAKIVEEGTWTPGSVVLATGENFPDALVASAVAGKLGCPVVLTRPDKLTEEAANKLKGATQVFVMGSEKTISNSVLSEVAALGVPSGGIKRIEGTDRQATSLDAMKWLDARGAYDGIVVVTTGFEFADALAIGPWCYADTVPILLADKNGSLSNDQLAALEGTGMSTKATTVIVLGGTDRVSSATRTKIKGIAGKNNVTELGAQSNSRYQTAGEIAEWEITQGMTAANATVATGKKFPDALAGAALCGQNRSVLLLADDDRDTSNALTVVSANKGKVETGYVLGDEKSVSENLFKRLNEITNE